MLRGVISSFQPRVSVCREMYSVFDVFYHLLKRAGTLFL